MTLFLIILLFCICGYLWLENRKQTRINKDLWSVLESMNDIQSSFNDCQYKHGQVLESVLKTLVITNDTTQANIDSIKRVDGHIPKLCEAIVTQNAFLIQLDVFFRQFYGIEDTEIQFPKSKFNPVVIDGGKKDD